MRTERLLQRAWQELESGNSKAAEETLLKIQAVSEAQALLGQLYYQQERYREAIPLLEKVLNGPQAQDELMPLLGAALQMAGRPLEALPWYRKILESAPNNPSHRYNLASALKDAQMFNEAAALFAPLVAEHPQHLRARNNYGATLQALGQYEAAADHFQAAVGMEPGYALAWLNLGDVRQALGQLTAAEYAFQQATQTLPDPSPAQARLGRICQQLGELEASAYWLRQALERIPQDATLWRSLGATLQALGKWEEAIQAFEQALNLQSDYHEARNNLGNLYKEQGRIEEALACFEAVQAAAPSDAQRIRLATLAPPVYFSLAEAQTWRERVVTQLAELAGTELKIEDPLREIGQGNFYLAYQGFNDRELQIQIAALYRPLLPESLAPQTPPPQSKCKRIGFLSGFFYNHSICHYYSQHILGLEPENFEVFLLLAPGNPSDASTDALSHHAKQTLRLPRDLAQARQQIADLHLDALIYPEIGMEPFSYFMAFTRLAPVQAVLPGHPVTTGIPTLDYFISNQPMELEEAQAHYSETLVTLPGLPVCYAQPDLPVDLLSRTELGLPEDKHIYLCPMTLFKIHPLMDKAFQLMLENDPLAEICFFKFQATHLHEALRKRFQASLGPLAERIRFLPWAPKREFFSLLTTAEVILDAHPFGGGSTHFLSLATGTPMVTWASPWLRGRSGAGLYHLLDLPELVTQTADSFAEQAVKIACEPSFRKDLSERILAGQPLLFNNPQGPQTFKQWLKEITHAVD
ncbi:hypothetical protein COW36_04505 [bacterium (Candidatus Blackallbacteria) CG17_big_fil_post_rev_8_21_14_2_50_48_46]|uniref:protein O-GlcNAc transferase n=1 Tax=bacterium (Candidatus Blackallbacteria) CG17_big_fil_post_rev_8_21_14_2_50_48_46 TaxID=2014261 RepID=A0A2M7G8X6_9BACT|nr:MAG: hypothetical protein COW64_04440 [bacterium (Candidatus Blackallbacteria) CG18_big_fil_WC_8_21_14_2_50_49_26]PIW18559.1 MAG: hypothetical protein COW36_04505 [bacterium (Candidatus Blackallbacteria) CG17_big_fil_post_rev_8_21_14_2_50_48_46]PIW46456.1 MAG: hypothetical protein COW20_16175 [bacterium (Candidatus Blackallbacteria) CG13_big_fil_rev_8_21_14_2_50_49_14]